MLLALKTQRPKSWSLPRTQGTLPQNFGGDPPSATSWSPAPITGGLSRSEATDSLLTITSLSLLELTLPKQTNVTLTDKPSGFA